MVNELFLTRKHTPSPVQICLSGSVKKAYKEFEYANFFYSYHFMIVHTIGCSLYKEIEINISGKKKDELDLLYLFKIEMADALLVLNKNHYIGKSTKREIEYAAMIRRPIIYLEDEGRENRASCSCDACIKLPHFAATLPEILHKTSMDFIYPENPRAAQILPSAPSSKF